MGILTVLEKKTKKIARRQNVKIGNSIVEKDNVFSNLGDAMAKKIVLQVIFRMFYRLILFICKANIVRAAFTPARNHSISGLKSRVLKVPFLT